MVLSCIMSRYVYCTGAQITYLGLLMKRTENARCDEKVVAGSDWMLELAETECCETFVPEWWMHTGGPSDFSVRSSWLYVTWTSCMTDGVFKCQTDKVICPSLWPKEFSMPGSILAQSTFTEMAKLEVWQQEEWRVRRRQRQKGTDTSNNIWWLKSVGVVIWAVGCMLGNPAQKIRVGNASQDLLAEGS